MIARSRQLLRRLHRDDRGAVMVSFILTLPIFWTITAIYVQLALLLVARLYVNHAAWVTARSAAVLLAEDEAPRVRRAAYTVLAPLSPAGPTATNAGTQINTALNGTGLYHATRFAQRYAYAANATRVRWTGSSGTFSTSTDKFAEADGDKVELTLSYEFFLTVPVAKQIIAPTVRTVGGVSGRFVRLERTVPFERTPGRLYGKTTFVGISTHFDQ